MRAAPIAFALVGLALVWAWLCIGVPLAVAASDGHGGVVAEALFTLAFYAPILIAAVVLGLVAHVPLGSGSHAIRAFGLGLAIGAAALALAVSYCVVAGTLRFGTGGASGALLAGVPMIALQVLAEEAMFRGTIQPLLVRGCGSTIGVIATALGFALLHGVGEGADPVALANMLLGGVLFGMLARRGGVAAAFGAHLAWNAIEQLGIGLDPNPGTGAFGALIDLDLVGALRWGGSDVGLNASWAMSFALATAVIVVAGWPRRTVAVTRFQAA